MARKKKTAKECVGCGRKFWTDKNYHYLCSDCVEIAYEELKCPRCGEPFADQDKGPLCNLCRPNESLEARATRNVLCSHRDPITGKQCESWAMTGSYYCKGHRQKEKPTRYVELIIPAKPQKTPVAKTAAEVAPWIRKAIGLDE